MTQNDIIQYIQQNLSLGYNNQSIKLALQQSGYTEQQINSAFDYISAQNHYGKQSGSQFAKPSAPSKDLLLLVSGGLVVVVVLAIALTMLFSTDSSNSYDSSSSQVRLEIEEPAPVKEYPIENATALVELNDVSDEEKKQIVTSDPVVQEQQRPSVTLSTTDTVLTRTQIDAQVDELKTTQPQKAAQLCQEIITRPGQSACYTKIAVATKDQTYCDLISDSQARDTCYMQFPINLLGGSIQTICTQIQNQYRQDSCVELYNVQDQLEQVKKQYPQDPALAAPTQPSNTQDLTFEEQFGVGQEEIVESNTGVIFGYE